MSDPDLVQLHHVHKRFRQGKIEVHALRGIDLTITSGEFTAIIGPSGSGKTTLLNLIGALDVPSEGEVLFAGRDLAKMTSHERSLLRRDRIGFVFQAYNLIPVLSAYENAEMVMALQGKSYAERHEQVMNLLREVGLENIEQRRPDELSGGQQQRVAIARAIAANSDLTLADEPTANLDSTTASTLLDLMQHLNQTHRSTFVFSTHDPRVVERAKRVIRLVDGQIESDERH